jgi:DNA replication and repair protein RecF
MIVNRLWLTDFRNHETTELSLDPRVTLVTGPNGHGKTNLLEALGLLAGMRSFRGATPEAMIRHGAGSAIVRADVSSGERNLLVEMEIAQGRSRVQVNRQPLRRVRDLGDLVRVIVFSPDDLELIKGGPSIRRGLLDDVLSSVDASFRQDRSDLDRVLRQRNNLLKQSGGRLTEDIEMTLDVWNDKLVTVGEAVARARVALVEALEPVVSDYYARVAGSSEPVGLSYDAPWMSQGLAGALESVQRDELRRGATLVGPHRDELVVSLNTMPARTHASQGEQRSLALALRLATHHHITALVGDSPLVLLDDVFSELDEGRATRLVQCLPEAQIVLTSATGTVPEGVRPGRVVELLGGSVIGGTGEG